MKKNKLTIVVLLIVSAMSFQGCSYPSEETTTLPTGCLVPHNDVMDSIESSESTDSVIDKTLLDISVTDDHFTGSLKGYEDNVIIDGQVLSSTCPEKVCIYRVIQDSTKKTIIPDNPFRNVWINTLPILESGKIAQSDKDEFISSFSDIELQNVPIFDELTTMYPDKLFCGYVIRTTYPASSDNIYQVLSADLEDANHSADTILDREFNHWFIRESINGIPLGLPYDMMTSDQYDNNGKKLYIYSLYSQMFYDGTDIYEVACIDNCFITQIKVEETNLHVTPFEEVAELIEPILIDMVSDSYTGNGPKNVYAAELVYLEVQTEGDGEGTLLYPFWAVYCDSGYSDASGDCAFRKPILINAITQDVYY